MKFWKIQGAIFSLVLLSGCTAVAGVAAVYAMKALENPTHYYKQDITHYPQFNSFIGREFVLLKDAYLYKYEHDDEEYLTGYRMELSKEIKQGTILEISQILVEATYERGEEKRIYIQQKSSIWQHLQAR